MSDMLREFPNNKNLCYKIIKDKGKACTTRKTIKKMNVQQFDGLLLDFGLTEEFRISVDLVFRELENSTTLEYIFPDSLTNDQRKYIHLKCKTLGFNHRSQGKEPHRKLRIWRANKTYQKVYHLEYNDEIEQVINNSLAKYTETARQNYYRNQNASARCPQNDQVFGRLSSGIAVNIPEPVPNRLGECRKQLPVWFKKNEILELLENSQVLIISSETGSGKTTQVPQFILENACARGDRCKVICTQPRRLSTIAVAERVAAERGEKVGETVGYQIKLETRIGVKSALIYCTNGILLRTLMNSSTSYLKNITHIIVDEIHERDKYTDFLLISLKRCLNNYPNLKVILMSATADVALFKSYFQTAILLNIPGKLHFIEELFLEDILLSLKDSNGNSAANGCNQTLYDIDVWRSENYRNQIPPNDPLNDCDETYAALIEDMKNTVTKCVNEGVEDYFEELMVLILSEGGDVNYQTPNTGYTPLIAAAIHGNLEITRQLLHYGADISLKSGSLTASEWADYYNKHEVRDMINRYNLSSENYDQQLESDNLLENYDRTVSHEAIDFSLIVQIITYIHSIDKHGTILIFLPGYDDITNCLQNIMAAPSIDLKEIEIFMLHSSMNIKAQHRVFEEIKLKQKIILSTNIAETSITIADVVYVIDTGRAKEKTYDTISGTCSLQTVWISKASVKQRAGRAGRTQEGVCFRLFSRKRYVSMLNNRIPEMLRVPLHELCLQTKLLAPSELKIADYLGLALEPPPSLSVENAIRGLKELGALKEDEELTSLGEHLVQLSVEPRLGKMLIYAVILKCLDPILTIVACLASKDPFTLPQNPRQKQIASERQRQLTNNSLSDHVAYLRAYQLWQQAEVTSDNSIKEFYINPATMQTIHETRTQLLSQLRGAGFITMQKQLTVQDANYNSSHWPIIKAVLAVGYYPNIAFGQNNNFATRMEKKIIFHKCSCLNVFTCDRNNCQRRINNYCIIFEELSKIGRHCSIKCGTAVTPFTVALLCGTENKQFEPHNLTIDEYLNFQHGYDKLAMFCLSLKTIINHKIANPRYILSLAEKNVLNALHIVLSIEEQQHELLVQPPAVGLVPKLFTRDQMFGGSHRRRNNDFNQRRSDSNQQRYDPSQHHGNFSGRQWEPRRTTHNRRQNSFRNEVIGSSSDMILNGLNINNAQALPISNSSGDTGNRINSLNEHFEDNLSKHPLNVESVNDISPYLSSRGYQAQNVSTSNFLNTFFNGLNIGSSPSTEPSINVGHVNDFDRYLPSGNSTVQNNIASIRQNNLAALQEKTCTQGLSSFNIFLKNKNMQVPAQNCSPSNVDNLSDVLLQALTVPKLRPINHSQMDFNTLGTSENVQPTNSTDIVPLERLDLPLNTAFFVIKPPDYSNFQMGISSSKWIFSPQTERKIFQFFNRRYFVVLLFSIAKTQEFQGIARLRDLHDDTLHCPIQWLSTMPIPYRRIRERNLTNSFDGGKLLFQCVDGQQVEDNAGRQLCSMFFEPALGDLQNFSRPILGCSTNK